jgi:hypothetical protein
MQKVSPSGFICTQKMLYTYLCTWYLDRQTFIGKNPPNQLSAKAILFLSSKLLILSEKKFHEIYASVLGHQV